MLTKFIDVSQGGTGNWGKFAIGRWQLEEWRRETHLPEAPGQPMLRGRGWTWNHVWVMDLQTGEAACFLPGGSAPADLNKHKIWVCPMFEPFLVWLYEQDLSDLRELPNYVELPDAEFYMAGYRREGTDAA